AAPTPAAPAPDPAAASQTTFQPAPQGSKSLFAPAAGSQTFETGPAAPVQPTPTAEPTGQRFEPQPIEPQAPAPAAPSSDDAATEVPILLTDLTSKFPDGLKQEIARLPSESVIMFPSEELGSAMKSAKIRFAWTQLRRWMLPKSNYASAAWEGTQVELPLKAVVGPFMAAMRGKPSKVKIPSASTAPAADTAPIAAAPTLATPYRAEPFVSSKPATQFAPTPPPMDGPVGIPPASGPAASATAPESSNSSLDRLLGHPGKTTWTPIEIVQHVSKIDGIGGAMLSLAEGQIAAAAINLDVKTDLIAFRVPRLLKLVAEHVEEMQLDSPTYVSFTAAGVQWISFKLGNIFFTVHGRTGENLPVTRLELRGCLRNPQFHHRPAVTQVPQQRLSPHVRPPSPE
ncbi:MAG: hypothetical protein ACPGVU_09290, partial [Limisphaerales bacterium]